jgi:hypothetical protein
VLGNPPWERIKLQEKEFFGSRDSEIATAQNKAEREKLIKTLPERKPELARAFKEAKYEAEAQSKFIRESKRFPLTAVGDINTYAIFAETVTKIISSIAQAGIIVPSAIVTADTTKDFFSYIATNGYLSIVLDFAEIRDFFIGVGSPDPFCLFVIRGKGEKKIPSEFVFKLLKLTEIQNPLRKIKLLPQDFIAINPNTKTCPIFRTNTDSELAKKIYKNAPIIVNETTLNNPWNINFKRGLFDMTNDSDIFTTTSLSNSSPLYEAKMIYAFDHRFGSYETRGDERGFATLPETLAENYQNLNYKITPFYWVKKSEVENRIGNWSKEWLIVFRGVTKALNERTAICTVIPKVGVGNSLSILFPNKNIITLYSCLIGNLNSLVFDFITRQKMSGVNLNIFIFKQLPIIPPESYTPQDIEFISKRVLELTYTAYDLKPFAEDMGYHGEPFIWDENRRTILRAELDAKYAKLYGLTCEELRYILDPADIYGPDFPSETFRVLKNNEIKKYGEYRTQKLVLAAWDMMGY